MANLVWWVMVIVAVVVGCFMGLVGETFISLRNWIHWGVISLERVVIINLSIATAAQASSIIKINHLTATTTWYLQSHNVHNTNTNQLSPNPSPKSTIADKVNSQSVRNIPQSSTIIKKITMRNFWWCVMIKGRSPFIIMKGCPSQGRWWKGKRWVRPLVGPRGMMRGRKNPCVKEIKVL